MDGGAWWAAISGVAQSQTRLSNLAAATAAAGEPAPDTDFLSGINTCYIFYHTCHVFHRPYYSFSP